MAKKNYSPEEYVRYTFGTEGLGSASTELANADRDINTIVKAMQSGAENAVLFNENLKKINKNMEEWSTSVMVKKSDAQTALDAGVYASSQIYGQYAKVNPQAVNATSGHFTNATAEEMVMLEYNRKRRGNLAKGLAKEEAEAFGGTFQKTNTDTVKIGYPVEKQKWLDILNNTYGGDVSKARAYFGKQMDKEMTKSAFYSKDLSARDREKQKEQEEKKQKKDEETNRRKTLTAFTKIISLMTAVVNICRRILNATLNRASELRQENMTSKALGISYQNYRQYDYAEGSLGLPKGTFTGAIGSLQSNFGDITNLNSKALEQLARVMGSEVRDLVESGIGGDNPEELMKKILDAYYQRGQSGVNSVGIYVGKEKAERELATALENAGLKELADILRNMYYMNDSGMYQGTIKNTDDYINLFRSFTGGLSAVDFASAKNLSTTIAELNERFQTLIKNGLTEFELKLGGFVKWLGTLGIGLSSAELLEAKQKDKEQNAEQAKFLQSNAQAHKNEADKVFSASGIALPTVKVKKGKDKGKNRTYTSFSEFAKDYYSGEFDLSNKDENNKALLQWLRTQSGQMAIDLMARSEAESVNAKTALERSTDESNKLLFDASMSDPAEIDKAIKDLYSNDDLPIKSLGKVFYKLLFAESPLTKEVDTYSVDEMFDYAEKNKVIKKGLTLKEMKKQLIKSKYGGSEDAFNTGKGTYVRQYPSLSEDEILKLMYMHETLSEANFNLLRSATAQKSLEWTSDIVRVADAVEKEMQTEEMRNLLQKEKDKGIETYKTQVYSEDNKIKMKITIQDPKGDIVKVRNLDVENVDSDFTTEYTNAIE